MATRRRRMRRKQMEEEQHTGMGSGIKEERRMGMEAACIRTGTGRRMGELEERWKLALLMGEQER